MRIGRQWVAVCLLSLGVAVAADRAGMVPIGSPLREARLDGLNGRAHRLSDYRGKPLVINLWASWCGPCRAETASLERLAWHEDAQHFRIIGISTDDERQAAKAWLDQSNATIPHFIDHNVELETMLGASRIPLTVLVDAEGRVVERVYGERQWDSPGEIARIRRAFRLDTTPRAKP
jgi:thiol-disulfide isomerase/thioredoxin